MNARRYDHVIELVRERPWAILPSVLATIRDVVAMHARGERLSDAEIRERVGAVQAQMGDRSGQSQGAGVAILPLYGVLFPKANLMTEMSGATSVQGFMRMFRSALADSEVKAIVIDVDSPGGLTDLATEAATEIRAARGQKPIVAVANTMMASCAYWIASQADEIVASPSALVGSIGVYAEHFDLSAAYELAGVNHSYISAGKFKTEGNEFAPLDEEAQRHIQEIVDDSYALFVNDVAKARGVSAQAVREGYGQGRVVTAKMALSEKLVDRIDTLDATVKRMVWLASRQKPAQARAEVVLDGINAEELSAWASRFGTLPTPDPIPEPEPDPTPEPEPGRFAFEKELLLRRRIPA